MATSKYQVQLFMMLLGCKPKGRHTEQHDVFFTAAHDLKSCIPDIREFWKDGGRIHIDCWRMIQQVEDYRIEMVNRKARNSSKETHLKLFFLNLGGYQPGAFEEFHYKYITVASKKSEAIQKAKATAFYHHNGFKGASSHIDDQYGIDVDDIYQIEDILPAHIKDAYRIRITENKKQSEDAVRIGYTNLSKIK